MNHIELFAGCGGLSLGLKSEGFKLLFANELSPMASETFAFNFFNENLAEIATSKNSKKEKNLRTKWLSSVYKRSDLSGRLRENPREYPNLGERESDVKRVNDLDGNLVVGSIVQLNEWLVKNPAAVTHIRNGFGAGSVDLVSGGPPCQSFSMSGLRDFSNARNILPWEFAKFVNSVQPRFALLENVTGILRPFQVDGRSVYAWIEVAKAFAAIKYIPICLHVNAKYVGVAQNRPRFLMLLVRKDVFDVIHENVNRADRSILDPSLLFYKKMAQGLIVTVADLPCYDVEDLDDLKLYKTSFLRPFVLRHKNISSVAQAIDDLSIMPLRSRRSGYVKRLRSELSPFLNPRSRVPNRELRNHKPHVVRRFSIYQNLSKVPLESKQSVYEAQAMLQGEAQALSRKAFTVLSQFEYMQKNGKKSIFLGKSELEQHLISHATKKQTQRALISLAPAPAALSIPDDACHYSELRTLSVREMARIQSFPDNFEFRSKVTTGGQARKFEVPQYTQVGNAVPPLLGIAIGQVFKRLDILSRKKRSQSGSN